jgi:hypothetical protein
VEARILNILAQTDVIAIHVSLNKIQEISSLSRHMKEQDELFMQLATDGQLKISTQHIIKEE